MHVPSILDSRGHGRRRKGLRSADLLIDGRIGDHSLPLQTGQHGDLDIPVCLNDGGSALNDAGGER